MWIELTYLPGAFVGLCMVLVGVWSLGHSAGHRDGRTDALGYDPHNDMRWFYNRRKDLQR